MQIFPLFRAQLSFKLFPKDMVIRNSYKRMAWRRPAIQSAQSHEYNNSGNCGPGGPVSWDYKRISLLAG